MTDGDLDAHAECNAKLQQASEEIAGLLWTTRNQAKKIGHLERALKDDGQRVRNSAEWKRCAALHKFWQRQTGHSNSPFTFARFKQAQPFLSEYGDDMLMRAIIGLAYDPYTTRNRNGVEERHDWWHTLFSKSDNIERYANKAPLTWKATLEEHAAEVRGRS